jgi:hypothetical protein
MQYADIIGQVQVGTTGFAGNLLEGLAAFGVFVVIMVAGWFVAGLLATLMRRFCTEIRIEKFLEKHGVHDAFVGFTFTNIIVALLKLYVMVFALTIAAGIVQIPVLAYLSAQAIGYLPMLFQGLIILMAGLLAGDYITDRIKASKKMPFANTFGIIVEIFIAYNALVIAMPMLLPAADPSLLVWSFLIVLAAFGIALGFGSAIAIGLGLKDVVADVQRSTRTRLTASCRRAVSFFIFFFFFLFLFLFFLPG